MSSFVSAQKNHAKINFSAFCRRNYHCFCGCCTDFIVVYYSVEWSDWRFFSNVHEKLEKGDNILALVYNPYNANMNVDVNEAVIDYVRVIKLNHSAQK